MQSKHIICGEAVETLKTFDSESVDLIITDPPYLCGYTDRKGRKIANDTNAEGVLPVFPELYRVLKEDSFLVLFCGWTAIAKFSAAWEAAGFRTEGQIIWPKEYQSSAWHLRRSHESAWLLSKGKPQRPAKPLKDVQRWRYSGNLSHPTEKAVQIIQPLIEAFSNHGDTVLDPFLGSGSTAVAAALSGRDYVGVELEQLYCDLAEKRLAGVQQFLAAEHQTQKVAA